MTDFVTDHDRPKRLGFPEVIFGEGKSADLLARIFAEYREKGQNALATRVQAEKAGLLQDQFTGSVYDPVSGCFLLEDVVSTGEEAKVGILSAGSSDQFAVNEAWYTLRFLGHTAERVMDIGVAGLHRLLDRVETIRAFQVLIVVAGFEGALPSVVGGLMPQPIIAVPTSVGYGVTAGGTTALHAMLSSCANGITVVNIDNGYGAAMAAHRIIQSQPQSSPS